jgi:hypothetical protein
MSQFITWNFICTKSNKNDTKGSFTIWTQCGMPIFNVGLTQFQSNTICSKRVNLQINTPPTLAGVSVRGGIRGYREIGKCSTLWNTWLYRKGFTLSGWQLFSQFNSLLLKDVKVHCHHHKSPIQDPNISQLNLPHNALRYTVHYEGHNHHNDLPTVNGLESTSKRTSRRKPTC